MHDSAPPEDFSIEEIERTMRFPKYFTHGFLGEDESLNEVIEQDEQTIGGIGVTHEDIASVIERLFLSDDTFFNGNPVLRMVYIASPLCPWKDFCAFEEPLAVVREVVLVNRLKVDEAFAHLNRHQEFEIGAYPELVRKDIIMMFSELHPHLIREHHFFEGHATPYRVDPKRVVRYLGIE